MSDTGRQSLTDKVGSAVKPDSQKSTTEQAGDYLKGKADSAASAMQPNNEKSTTQKAGDALSSSNSNQVNSGDSLLNKAKNAMGLNDSNNDA